MVTGVVVLTRAYAFEMDGQPMLQNITAPRCVHVDDSSLGTLNRNQRMQCTTVYGYSLRRNHVLCVFAVTIPVSSSYTRFNEAAARYAGRPTIHMSSVSIPFPRVSLHLTAAYRILQLLCPFCVRNLL